VDMWTPKSTLVGKALKISSKLFKRNYFNLLSKKMKDSKILSLCSTSSCFIDEKLSYTKLK